MPRVVHFEIRADDPHRAVGFYEKVFGWTIAKWEGPFDYWLVTTGSEDELGTNCAITPRIVSEQVTTDTVGVESVDNSLKKIVEAGGTVTQPKQAVPGIGYVAYCTDTEGNLFGVIQPDVREIAAVLSKCIFNTLWRQLPPLFSCFLPLQVNLYGHRLKKPPLYASFLDLVSSKCR